jgi:hypothetical protein
MLPARSTSASALRRLVLLASAPLLAGGLLACAPPEEEPIYDDDLGLQGASTEPGALDGTWVLKTSIVTLADLPVDGVDQTAGGETYYKLDLDWDADAEAYTQTIEICGGRIYDTAGTESEISLDRWQMVPPSSPLAMTINHATGEYVTEDIVELWAIDLPNPVGDAMPADGIEAQDEPHASRIFDADDDGNPGMTMHLSGLAIGDVFFCQRKMIHQDGLFLSDSEAAGLLDFSYEQITLGATNPVLNQQLPRERHPNPKEAWFWQVKLEEGATCDDVLTAVDDEVVPRINPFL